MEGGGGPRRTDCAMVASYRRLSTPCLTPRPPPPPPFIPISVVVDVPSHAFLLYPSTTAATSGRHIKHHLNKTGIHTILTHLPPPPCPSLSVRHAQAKGKTVACAAPSRSVGISAVIGSSAYPLTQRPPPSIHPSKGLLEQGGCNRDLISMCAGDRGRGREENYCKPDAGQQIVRRTEICLFSHLDNAERDTGKQEQEQQQQRIVTVDLSAKSHHTDPT
ncbi:hypothetical protein LX32DRAFT_185157 [Colletotrichum zoysiae]|uniref:Uncharacterized protein n=1 Tax=Colletotrichum zoysiae TaxID=1216348 RepID=A0AAD9H5K3_9PEZI|nr:hypothetical protein LX32DRAFT_185157 [Colletotrichum zoysiae]